MKGATCKSTSPQDFCSAAVPYQLRSHCRARSAVLSKSETPKAVNSGATPASPECGSGSARCRR